MISRKTAFVILLLLILCASYLVYTHKSKTEIIINNDIYSKFDNSPITLENDLLVPMEDFLKALGISNYSWSKVDNRIYISLGHQRVVLWLGKSYGLVNGSIIDGITAPRLKKSELYLPLTVLSQGFDFSWNYRNRLLNIQFPDFKHVADFISQPVQEGAINTDFMFYGIGLGDLQEKLINYLGWPSRIDVSLFDFEWWVYNQSYNHYIQFGVKDNKVVAISTNSSSWGTINNISNATTKEDLLKIYGQGSAEYSIGNTVFKDERIQNNQLLHYDFEGYTVSFFVDDTQNTIDAIEIYSEEVKINTFLTHIHLIELSVALERQLFDLTNASRVKSNLHSLDWDNRLSQVARSHSEDMAINNFFDHVNSSGQTLAHRLAHNNINFLRAGENIVSGYQNSLNSYHALLNSTDHRSNMLNQHFTKLGVGFSINQNGSLYLTQVFLQD